MYGKRIPLARFAGFDIRLDPSWILLLILISWSLALGVFPQNYPQLSPTTWWTMGIVSAAGLLCSILLHELSHSFVARRYGMVIQGITLFLFGGVSEVKAEPDRPGTEFAMAIIGPIVSLVLGFIFYAFTSVGRASAWPDAVVGVLSYLAQINVVLAVFNLLPGFPLDGGRVLRAALWAWKKNFIEATRIATKCGTIFGFILVALGILNAFRGDFLGGMWLALIGLFLRSAALISYEQVLVQKSLQGETVRRFMNRHPITVPPTISIQEFVDDYIFPYQHKMFPVVENGRLFGCARMEDLTRVPRTEWAQRSVSDLAVTCPANLVVLPETDANQALRQMQQSGNNCLVVAEGDRFLGIVALKDMMKRLAFKMEMEGHEAMAA